MFPTRLFPRRFFPRRHFALGFGLPVPGSVYFAPRLFAPHFFAPRLFVQAGGTALRAPIAIVTVKKL